MPATWAGSSPPPRKSWYHRSSGACAALHLCPAFRKTRATQKGVGAPKWMRKRKRKSWSWKDGNLMTAWCPVTVVHVKWYHVSVRVLWPRNVRAGYCFTSVCFWYSGWEEWPKISERTGLDCLPYGSEKWNLFIILLQFSAWWNLPCSCVAKMVCDMLKFEVKNDMEINFASIIKRCVSAVECRLSLQSESFGLIEQSSSDWTALCVCLLISRP